MIYALSDKAKFLCIVGLTLTIAACDQLADPPIIFIQKHKVGIAIEGSPIDQSAKFVLGVEDENYAILPLTSPQEHLKNGKILRNRTRSVAKQHSFPKGNSTRGFIDEDTFSVFGQFEVGTSQNNATRQINIGKFFATGFAARSLAEGYKNLMSGNSTNSP